MTEKGAKCNRARTGLATVTIIIIFFLDLKLLIATNRRFLQQYDDDSKQLGPSPLRAIQLKMASFCLVRVSF